MRIKGLGMSDPVDEAIATLVQCGMMADAALRFVVLAAALG